MVEVGVYLPPDKNSKAVIVDPLDPRNRIEIFWGERRTPSGTKVGWQALISKAVGRDGEVAGTVGPPIPTDRITTDAQWSVSKAPVFIVSGSNAELKAWVDVVGGGNARVSLSTKVPQIIATDGKKSAVVYRNVPGIIGPINGDEYIIIMDVDKLRGLKVYLGPIAVLTEEQYIPFKELYALAFKEVVSHYTYPGNTWWTRKDPLRGGLTIGDLFLATFNGEANPGPLYTYKGTVRIYNLNGGFGITYFTSNRGEREINFTPVWPPKVSINSTAVTVGGKFVITVDLPGKATYNVVVRTDFIPCGAVGYYKKLTVTGPRRLTFTIPACRPGEGKIYVSITSGQHEGGAVFEVEIKKDVAVSFTPGGGKVPPMGTVKVNVSLAGKHTYDVNVSWDVDGRQRKSVDKKVTGPTNLVVPIKVIPGRELHVYYWVKQGDKVVAQGVKTFKIETYPYWAGPINFDVKMAGSDKGVVVSVVACNTVNILQPLNMAVAFNDRVTRRYETQVRGYSCWRNTFAASPPRCGDFKVDFYLNGRKVELGTVRVPCPKKTAQPTKPTAKPTTTKQATPEKTAQQTKPTPAEKSAPTSSVLLGIGFIMLYELMKGR